MEATASSALLRRVAFTPRREAGDGGMTPARNRPAMVKMENKFKDQWHLRYYAAAMQGRCGPKKEEKRRMKLAKGLEKDLSTLYSMGFDGIKGQDQGQTISEASELLLAQLTKLRAEAKEMKQRRRQEKAAMKDAKMKGRAAKSSSSSESSSSESSDSECETVMKMNRSSLRTAATASDPVAAAALQTEGAIEEAKSNLVLNLEPHCCSSSAEVALQPTEGMIEVCMGGKCKKSGAMELMSEFEKEVGVEGAVVGCKCMGKCRDGPNVRVVNHVAAVAAPGDALMMKIVKGPLCIGVGLEDVGPIVAKFLGESMCVGLQHA